MSSTFSWVQAPTPRSSIASFIASTLRMTEEALWDAALSPICAMAMADGVLPDALDP